MTKSSSLRPATTSTPSPRAVGLSESSFHSQRDLVVASLLRVPERAGGAKHTRGR